MSAEQLSAPVRSQDPSALIYCKSQENQRAVLTGHCSFDIHAVSLKILGDTSCEIKALNRTPLDSELAAIEIKRMICNGYNALYGHLKFNYLFFWLRKEVIIISTKAIPFWGLSFNLT